MDCPITRGYNANSGRDSWGLEKDAMNADSGCPGICEAAGRIGGARIAASRAACCAAIASRCALAASRALTRVPLTGRWRAAVHRR